MPIVSISLTKDFLKEMDELQSSEGFSGRSELIRAGIRSLINQKADRENLVGAMQCILLITHEEGEEHSVTDIKHEFDKITKSHLHYKLGERKCLELLIVDGKASEIQELMRRLQVSGEVDNIKLIRT
jgi:CopG family nickel-responsive transcriptional regulator|tara:strand:- start:3625 stop:4008 length:384 start_codon:yes stop_codon:yes gene_type:complete